jgi:hypothetical protein
MEMDFCVVFCGLELFPSENPTHGLKAEIYKSFKLRIYQCEIPTVIKETFISVNRLTTA